jgi:hypothetical protein
MKTDTNIRGFIETPTSTLEIKLLPNANSAWFKKNNKTINHLTSLSEEQIKSLEEIIVKEFRSAIKRVEKKVESFISNNQLQPETT